MPGSERSNNSECDAMGKGLTHVDGEGRLFEEQRGNGRRGLRMKVSDDDSQT